jgi:diacylglycerol kinase family enzyme
VVPDVIAETAIQVNEKMRKDGKMRVWTSVTRPHMAAKPRMCRCHITTNAQPRRQPHPMLTHITPHSFPGPGAFSTLLFIKNVLIIGQCFE